MVVHPTLRYGTAGASPATTVMQFADNAPAIAYNAAIH
jgi:hypothetical protein